MPKALHRIRATACSTATAALLAALLLACSGGSGSTSGGGGPAEDSSEGNAQSADRDRPPGDPLATVTEQDVRDAVEQIPDEVAEVLERSGVPGASITVVHGDEVVYARGFGVRDLDSGEPVDEETVFQLASLSKPISATVVSALVGRGELDWSDPVVEHTPGFELSDPMVSERVSVGDLFSHRSGLPGHAGDLLEDLGFDREEILARLSMQPLAGFRDSYAYTNFGLTEAAVAAAAAAGGTWEELTESVLFEPAGMEHTTDSFEEFLSEPNRASPHVRDAEGNWVVGEQRDPSAQSPAGGVASNAEDLGAWLRIQLADGALDGEQIVAEGELTRMRTPQALSGPPSSPSARSSFYGFGLGVGDRDDGFVGLSHSGAFLMGAATAVGIVPGQDLAVAVITNGQPVGAAETLREVVLDLAIHGEVTRNWWELYSQRFEGMYEPSTPTDWGAPVEQPAPARADTAYLGTYSNDYYGPLEVRQGASGLEMVLGPESMVFPLTHHDGDSFLFTPPGENSLGPTGITFGFEGASGDGGSSGDVAVAATVEYYDETGLGTWVHT